MLGQRAQHGHICSLWSFSVFFPPAQEHPHTFHISFRDVNGLVVFGCAVCVSQATECSLFVLTVPI